MPNRGFGMFTVTVPKDTPPNEQLWWVLTVNGVIQRVPLHRSPDYNITLQRASEEGPGGKYNTPPILRFSETGTAIQNPTATLATAAERVATAGKAMRLDLWVEDDGLHASGFNAPVERVTAHRRTGREQVSRPGSGDRGQGPREIHHVERWQGRGAVRRQGLDDRYLRTARRIPAARHRQRPVRTGGRRDGLLLDDQPREGVGEEVTTTIGR